MRLALDGTVLAWNPHRGIPRIYREIIPRVPALAPDVETVVAMPEGRRAGLPDGVGVEWVKIRSIPRSLRPWRLWRPVRASLNRVLAASSWRRMSADVFHVTLYGRLPVKAPVYCFVYDMIAELHPEGFDRRFIKHMADIKRHAFRQCERLLCISEKTKCDVVRLMGVPEEKCRVVYLGSDLLRLSAADPVEDGSHRPYLLYVGGYRIPYKNFGFLLRCMGSREFKGFDGLDLRVVSPEQPSLAERKAFESLLPGHRVEFVSDCDDATLARFYRGCAAVVHPSLYEGFGLPVLEGLQAGAPVVCSNAASLPEVGGDAVYYFSPQSSTELRLALEDALKDGREQTSVRRRRNQAAKFSWDATARAFVETACELAQGGC